MRFATILFRLFAYRKLRFSIMLAVPIRRITNLLRNPRLGWVGIDISRNAIHLAQVRRSGSSYELNTTWTAFQPSTPGREFVQSEDAKEDNGSMAIVSDPQNAFEQMIDQARNARSLFHHATAAFTVGDGSIDYRELELDMSDPSEIDRAVRYELEKEPGYDFGSSIVKAWAVPTNRRSQVNKQNTAIVATDYGYSMWLGEMTAKAGYSPEVFDALPCAIARSVELFLAGADQPCLVAHIGDTFTTLSLIRQGMPVLTRILNQHGFDKVLTPLGEEFAIRPIEVSSLLVKLAQDGLKACNGSTDLMEIVSEYQLRFVQSLAAEIYRTLEYIRAEHSDSIPTGILLCGDGSVLPGMSLQFEQLLELPTEPWSLALGKHTSLGLPTSLYAVAAGLSAIAWEQT